jgi:hypothetical protein
MSADHGKANIKYSSSMFAFAAQQTQWIKSLPAQAPQSLEVVGPNLPGLAWRSLRPRPLPTNSYAFDEKVGIASNDRGSSGRFQAEVAIRVSYATF